MKLINKCRTTADRAIASRWFIPVQALIAGIAIAAGRGIIGSGILLAGTALLLIFSDDTLAALCPVLLVVMAVTEYYADYYALVQYAWALIPLGAALIVHIAAYRGEKVNGRFFFSLAGVSLALLLGGVGTISEQEYFSGVSLYYMLGLGVGLLLVYLLLSSRLATERDYDEAARLAELMYAMALLAAVIIMRFYATHLQVFTADFKTPFIAYRNFCTTVMLFGLPMSFFLIKRSHWHLLGAVLIYAAMLAGGSRSGLLFGTLEAGLCLVYIYIKNPQSRRTYRRIALICAVPVLAICAVLIYSIFLGDSGRFSEHIIRPEEARTRFYPQGIADFLARPALGYGIANSKNSNIFLGVNGSIVFYHNSVIQVLASLGIVGAAAYIWQFVQRLQTLWNHRHDDSGWLMGIAYLGVLLISQTNPGLFCPLPTALLLVMMFAVLEAGENKTSSKGKLSDDSCAHGA